jgi:hypothetical protein
LVEAGACAVRETGERQMAGTDRATTPIDAKKRPLIENLHSSTLRGSLIIQLHCSVQGHFDENYSTRVTSTGLYPGNGVTPSPVLYDVLAGRRPFTGASDPDFFHAITHGHAGSLPDDGTFTTPASASTTGIVSERAAALSPGTSEHGPVRCREQLGGILKFYPHGADGDAAQTKETTRHRTLPERVNACGAGESSSSQSLGLSRARTPPCCSSQG